MQGGRKAGAERGGGGAEKRGQGRGRRKGGKEKESYHKEFTDENLRLNRSQLCRVSKLASSPGHAGAGEAKYRVDQEGSPLTWGSASSPGMLSVYVCLFGLWFVHLFAYEI